VSGLAEEFDAFWAAFPRRTGKLDAIRAYAKARRIDSAENILAGVERYKRNKPEYADWCHPSTFLNKGRWMDEDDQPVVLPAKEYWADVCQREHGGACRNRWTHEMLMRERESA
jgi:hypothetical protein